jgi:hypothetical protein
MPVQPTFTADVASESATCGGVGVPTGGIHVNEVSAALTDEDGNAVGAAGNEAIIVDLTIPTP